MWTCCAAVAMRTERMVFGPMVTPLARRRPQVLARQAASLAVLSGERFVLGLGLGDDWVGEFSDYGDEADPKAAARLLDEGLDALTGLLGGGFRPAPTGADLAGRPVPEQGAGASSGAVRRLLRDRPGRPDDLAPSSMTSPQHGPGAGFDVVVDLQPRAGPGTVARPGRLVGADPDRALRPRPGRRTPARRRGSGTTASTRTGDARRGRRSAGASQATNHTARPARTRGTDPQRPRPRPAVDAARVDDARAGPRRDAASWKRPTP